MKKGNCFINIAYFQFVISFLVVIVIYTLAILTKGQHESGYVYITNALIIIYSLIHLISNENTAYSARKMFYLFIFFFMGIAPLMQYKFGTETVGGYVILEETYVFANLIIFFNLIVFDIFYTYYFRYSIGKQLNSKRQEKDYIETKKWRYTLLAISLLSVIITIYYFRDRPYLLVLRGIEDIIGSAAMIENNDTSLIEPLFNCIIRPLSAVCCINYLAIGKKARYKFLFIILMVIGCFPTSLARLRTAAYYIPVLIMLFPGVRYRNKFAMLFISGFLILFPLLNNFRVWGNSTIKSIEIDFEMFCNMNYDSFQSFAFVLQNEKITYGSQLMVALFFWIPRSIWPNKPYMSGKMIAKEYNLSFDQISMNYFGEGYLNAGLAGVIIFTIILALISAKFDFKYWIVNHGNTHSLYAPFFLFFIGMYFFFMRGDLMFGFEYTSCLLITNYLIYKISTKKLPYKMRQYNL